MVMRYTNERTGANERIGKRKTNDEETIALSNGMMNVNRTILHLADWPRTTHGPSFAHLLREASTAEDDLRRGCSVAHAHLLLSCTRRWNMLRYETW